MDWKQWLCERGIPFAPFVLGLATTLVFGFAVERLVKRVKRDMQSIPPRGIAAEKWERATELGDLRGVRWLGGLERIILYTAFWMSLPTLAAAWLAFKLASKWEVWQHIIQVPQPKGDFGDSIDYLATCHRWASQVLQSWLVGTAASIVLALAGVAVSKVVTQVLGWTLCS